MSGRDWLFVLIILAPPFAVYAWGVWRYITMSDEHPSIILAVLIVSPVLYVILAGMWATPFLWFCYAVHPWCSSVSHVTEIM